MKKECLLWLNNYLLIHKMHFANNYFRNKYFFVLIQLKGFRTDTICDVCA